MSTWCKSIWIGIGLLIEVSIAIIYFFKVPSNVENLEFVEVAWWNIRDLSTSSRDEMEIG